MLLIHLFGELLQLLWSQAGGEGSGLFGLLRRLPFLLRGIHQRLLEACFGRLSGGWGCCSGWLGVGRAWNGRCWHLGCVLLLRLLKLFALFLYQFLHLLLPGDLTRSRCSTCRGPIRPRELRLQLFLLLLRHVLRESLGHLLLGLGRGLRCHLLNGGSHEISVPLPHMGLYSLVLSRWCLSITLHVLSLAVLSMRLLLFLLLMITVNFDHFLGTIFWFAFFSFLLYFRLVSGCGCIGDLLFLWFRFRGIRRGRPVFDLFIFLQALLHVQVRQGISFDHCLGP